MRHQSHFSFHEVTIPKNDVLVIEWGNLEIESSSPVSQLHLDIIPHAGYLLGLRVHIFNFVGMLLHLESQ